MKNRVERNWNRMPVVAEWVTHVMRHHRKKKGHKVPVLATVWVPNKPGRNSWLVRRR